MTVQYAAGEEGEEAEDVLAPSTLSASQVATETIKFGIGGLPVQCESATATGSLSTGFSPTLTLAPKYSKCKALFGILPAEINTGSCSLTFGSLEAAETDVFNA